MPDITAETVRAAADEIAKRLLSAEQDAATARAKLRNSLRNGEAAATEKFAADLAFADGAAAAYAAALIAINQATGVDPTVL